mmetsp:Transcript_157/g.337  ORF Transcript_157/g.337 Transcript_157/m.337 type:complete len:207 (+) Transcript_157:944-1564(+)
MAMVADHEVVVLELELRHGRDGGVRLLEVPVGVVHPGVLLLLLLLRLLRRQRHGVQVHLAHVLARLLRRRHRRLLVRLDDLVERLGVDLAAQDLRADEVLLVQAQPHLLLDKEDLLVLAQRAVRLHRHLLHDLRRLLHLALLLLDLRQHARQPRLLHLHEDLAGRHRVQRLDQLRLHRQGGRLVDVGHGLLDHSAQRLLQLRAALG